MKTLTPIIEGLHYANTLCSIIGWLQPSLLPHTPPHPTPAAIPRVSQQTLAK